MIQTYLTKRSCTSDDSGSVLAIGDMVPKAEEPINSSPSPPLLFDPAQVVVQSAPSHLGEIRFVTSSYGRFTASVPCRSSNPQYYRYTMVYAFLLICDNSCKILNVWHRQTQSLDLKLISLWSNDSRATQREKRLPVGICCISLSIRLGSHTSTRMLSR